MSSAAFLCGWCFLLSFRFGTLSLCNSLGLDFWDFHGILRLLLVNLAPWNVVHILQMSAKVSTLSECFMAIATSEGSLAGVLSEVVSQIATLLENTVTAWILTAEEQLDALSLLIPLLDCLMPLSWDTSKSSGNQVHLMLRDL